MDNKNRQLEIIKSLNDNRNKLSALFSLYNSSLIVAEEKRSELINFYEQMLDLRNDATSISNVIYNSKKDERVEAITKNKSKIKKLTSDINQINSEFQTTSKTYKVALQECGSLKTEYKHEVSDLCKEFKASVDESTDPIIIKGYKQQVKIIKAILDRIELLISDYNVKKNKVETDDEKFDALYSSVNQLLSKIEEIA